MGDEWNPKDTIEAIRYLKKRKSIYLIGTFGNWRDFFIDSLPDYDFNDPREHNQSSISKLDREDMGAAQNCEISLVYIPKGKNRAGVTSYAEMGAARASGNSIIVVDEGTEIDKFSKAIACYYFQNKEEAVHFLRTQNIKSFYDRIPINNRTKTIETYENILFTGDLDKMQGLIKKMQETKRCFIDYNPLDVNDFSKKYDLIVVNFNRNKDQDKKGLFALGLTDATDMVAVELEGNPIPYPPLAGLNRRFFVGKDRFKHAEYYLTKLDSQHISDEALVYYDVMKNFNIPG